MSGRTHQRTDTNLSVEQEFAVHGLDGIVIDPYTMQVWFDRCRICAAKGLHTCAGHDSSEETRMEQGMGRAFSKRTEEL